MPPKSASSLNGTVMAGAVRAALGVAVLGGFLFGGASAFGATAPAGGTVNFWGTPNSNGPGGTILLTGAIGDYGKTISVNSAGKPEKKGGYTEAVLKKGSILVNTTQLNSAVNAAFNQGSENAATCSASITVTGSLPIVSGTKAYAGITGTLTDTISFAAYGPYYTHGSKKGQCNEGSNATPTDQWASSTGSGTVSFG